VNRRYLEVFCGLDSPRSGPNWLEREEPTMPVYEYRCKECNKEFTVTMSISEKESKKVTCPSCQKEDSVEQLITPFMTKTSRKS